MTIKHLAVAASLLALAACTTPTPFSPPSIRAVPAIPTSGWPRIASA